METVDNISNLNINDSILIRTTVLNGSVEMELSYIDNYETQRTTKRMLVFSNCRRVLFSMNTGDDSPNSLLDAVELESTTGRKIRIETNTTAGMIEIECDKIFLYDSTR